MVARYHFRSTAKNTHAPFLRLPCIAKVDFQRDHHHYRDIRPIFCSLFVLGPRLLVVIFPYLSVFPLYF